MLKSLQILTFAAVLSLSSASVFADDHAVEVGGAPMFDDKNIIENAVNSQDHTTLVAAVKAAGLVEILSGDGPFTVFAPVNDGFAALPEGAVENLLKPENKDQLVKVLTAHVVAGKISAQDLTGKIDMAGDAGFEIATVSGDALIAKMIGGAVVLIDENGGQSTVTIADVNQSNGVIHVVDKVLLPK